jgi:RNA polymerase sigma-70 factor (ECF subfamily)
MDEAIMIENNITQVTVIDEDAGLVTSFKAGDRPSFDELVKKYKDRIFRVALTMLQDKTEADDVTQEVFMRVYTKIGSFKETSTFFTWMYSIAVNECRHALRKKKHVPVSLDTPLEENEESTLSDLLKSKEENMDHRLVREEETGLAYKLINTLPEKYRTIYVLRNVDDLSYNEIAGIMGISVNKVKVWLFRAREKLDMEVHKQ